MFEINQLYDIMIFMNKYDVAVIGGGPAGLMAAGRAGEIGIRSILVEKNQILGKKLLITGKGRCNLTNAKEDLNDFINQFGKNGKFFYSALFLFSPTETMDFFEKYGVKTKIERGNRVFPISDSSKQILEALMRYSKDFCHEIKLGAKVEKIIKKEKRIEKIILSNGEEIIAKNFILCSGGKSYSSTGSTGDGYKWLKDLGHKITPLFPSLVPIIVKEKIVKELEGLSLKNVEINLFQKGKKINSRFGEAIFTSDGLSGPIILDLSQEIEEKFEDLKIKIDFKPALNYIQLDKRLQKDFMEANNKIFKNSLDKLLPQKLIPVIINLSEIDPEKRVNLITKQERKKILHLLKEFTLEIEKLGGYERAIITKGGVDLSEIEPKTMRSKIIDNLYLAGEILDLNGPTGGYNLQVCWSTGYLAGESAGKSILKE